MCDVGLRTPSEVTIAELQVYIDILNFDRIGHQITLAEGVARLKKFPDSPPPRRISCRSGGRGVVLQCFSFIFFLSFPLLFILFSSIQPFLFLFFLPFPLPFLLLWPVLLLWLVVVVLISRPTIIVIIYFILFCFCAFNCARQIQNVREHDVN